MKPLFQNFQFLMTASISYNFRIVLSFMDVYFAHTQLSRNKMFFLTSASNDSALFFIITYCSIIRLVLYILDIYSYFLFTQGLLLTYSLLLTYRASSLQYKFQAAEAF